MKRQYGLVGDKTVIEEKEVILTERRYIWGSEATPVKDEEGGAPPAAPAVAQGEPMQTE
jgi:hypothetical protein